MRKKKEDIRGESSSKSSNKNETKRLRSTPDLRANRLFAIAYPLSLSRAREKASERKRASERESRDVYIYNEKKKKKNKTKLEKNKTHFTSSGSHSFAGTHAANKHWCFLLVVVVVELLFPPPPPSLRSIDPRHESEEARIVFLSSLLSEESEDIFFSLFLVIGIKKMFDFYLIKTCAGMRSYTCTILFCVRSFSSRSFTLSLSRGQPG